MRYQEAIDWLYGTQRFGVKLGLEQVRRLLEAAGVSLDGPGRYIQVAGTNGKGSVCAFLDAICRQGGYRTGLFTSPHLIEFGERIRLDGAMMPRPEIARGLTALRAFTEDWSVSPTFFEFTTVLALRYFQEKKAEVIILEAGMGGRLDATNVVRPIVSVLTSIAMDHQRWLGNEIEDIANEKAGIIKSDLPAVSAPQGPRATKVLQKIAKIRGSRLTFVKTAYEGAMSLPGRFQRTNAALAAAAAQVGGLEIPAAQIAAGIARAEWKGRFQRVEPDLVVDGAHNPAAMNATAATWREEFGEQKATVVMGVLADKDVLGILAQLAPIAGELIAVPVSSPRSIPAENLRELANAALPSVPTSAAKDLVEALRSARHSGRPILIAGSLFLVGEALAHFEERTNELRASAQ